MFDDIQTLEDLKSLAQEPDACGVVLDELDGYIRDLLQLLDIVFEDLPHTPDEVLLSVDVQLIRHDFVISHKLRTYLLDHIQREIKTPTELYDIQQIGQISLCQGVNCLVVDLVTTLPQD